MKIIPALTGPMSGKLGGMVASRNRGGQYFRRKAVPVNPDSTRQVAVRSNFATLISAWNNELTPEERESWIMWAANTPRIDSLGQSHILTGQNAFVGFNSLRLLAGEAIVTENTGVFNRGEAVAVGTIALINPGPPELEYNFVYNAPASGAGDSLIFIGRPQNLSTSFYKGPYRFTVKVPFTSGGAIADGSLVLTTLPYVISGNQNIPIKVVNVFDDGRYTASFESLLPVGSIPPP